MHPQIAPDVAEQAASAAMAAAARAGVAVTLIRDAEGAHRASQLLTDIWETGSRPIVPAEMIRSLAHVNGYGALALSGDEPIGAALGFIGSDDDGPLLHSYIAGVATRHRGGSVGFALKQHQRSWALARGLNRITWTFDPLVRRNAHFNLVKLGAAVSGFHRDFYGEMDDGVNTGDLSDRILVEWKLDAVRAVRASERRPEHVDVTSPDGYRAVARLSVGADGSPHVVPEGGAIELVQIPDDIVAARRLDPDLGRRWRFAIRDTLGAAVAAGASIAGFTSDGCYVVDRRP